MPVLIETSPGRISKLLQYQVTIVEANNNYTTISQPVKPYIYRVLAGMERFKPACVR